MISYLDVRPSDVVRFWSYVKVDSPDSCWYWTGGGSRGSRRGYGAFWVCGKTVGAHFFSYLIHNKLESLLARGFMVCHSCDHPLCVNPNHLFLGTTQDNMNDMKAKGRQVRGERAARGKLIASQVIYIRSEFSGGRKKPSELARMFGVSNEAIYAILQRKNWKHI